MAGKGRYGMCKKIVLTVVIITLAGTAAAVLAASPSTDANQGVKPQQAVKPVETAKPAETTKTAGLVGWWKFDEKDGNTAHDSSGNGFSATVHPGGGPSIWAPGQGFDSNGCAKFTATQYVLIPNSVWSRVKQQLSIAFWVNQDAKNPPGESWPGPWGCEATAGRKYPDPNWLLMRAYLPTPNKKIDIGRDEEHVSWDPADPNTYAGKWNLYVFIKDVNDHTLTLYHNGENVAKISDTTEPMPKLNNFFIGGRTYPTADWNGKIDDFRIYNIALTQEEIQKLYESKPKK
jgi:hypothetical protein